MSCKYVPYENEDGEIVMPRGHHTDLSGCTFGKWYVIELAQTHHSRRRVYRCKCECGTIRNIQGSQLIALNSTRCNMCYRKSIDTRLFKF